MKHTITHILESAPERSVEHAIFYLIYYSARQKLGFFFYFYQSDNWSMFSFMNRLCRSLFVFLPFFTWSLCCLSFDLLLLTTRLVTCLRTYMTNCRVQIFRWGVISNYEYIMHQYLNMNLLGFTRHTTYAYLDMYSFCDVWIKWLRISKNLYIKLSFWYRKCKHVEWICLVYIIPE
jgi:hypothetical protein